MQGEGRYGSMREGVQGGGRCVGRGKVCREREGVEVREGVQGGGCGVYFFSILMLCVCLLRSSVEGGGSNIGSGKKKKRGRPKKQTDVSERAVVVGVAGLFKILNAAS